MAMVEGDDFEDLPYGAEGSKSSSSKYEEGGGGDGESLTPTSPIPSDVEIPIETIYGDNRPIAGAAEKEAQRSAESQKRDSSTSRSDNNSGSGSSSSTSSHSSTEQLTTQNQKVIRINALAALIVLAIIAASAFYGGKLISQHLNQKSQSSENSPNPATSGGDESTSTKDSTNTSSTTSSGSSATATSSERPKTRSGFIRDLGSYDRAKSYSDIDMAEARCGLAKQKIIWFTSNPENPNILKILTNIKRERGVSVFIVCGSETKVANLETARNTGLPVYRIKTELDNPYSLLIIDSKIILDISRERWIWESSEPKIVQETIRWAEDFISTADILQ